MIFVWTLWDVVDVVLVALGLIAWGVLAFATREKSRKGK